MDIATAYPAAEWDAPPPIGTPEHAMWLVHWHFAFENADQLEKLAELYHDDIIWEVPVRNAIYYGKKDVLENYARIFESISEEKLVPIDRWGTTERVFDDLELTFKLANSKGFPNHPLPVGTRVAMRMVHSFQIRDGLIIRENGYEQWRPDTSF